MRLSTCRDSFSLVGIQSYVCVFSALRGSSRLRARAHKKPIGSYEKSRAAFVFSRESSRGRISLPCAQR